MSRTNKNDSRQKGSVLVSRTFLGTMPVTLGGTLTMDADMPTGLCLNPGGAGRTVLLPPEEEGLAYFIANAASGDEDLTIKEDSNTTTIGTISQNETAWVVCMGGVWRISVGTTT